MDSDLLRSQLGPLFGGYWSKGGRDEKLTAVPHIVLMIRTIVLCFQFSILLYRFHRDILFLV